MLRNLQEETAKTTSGFDWLLVGSSILLVSSLLGWLYVLWQTYVATE